MINGFWPVSSRPDMDGKTSSYGLVIYIYIIKRLIMKAIKHLEKPPRRPPKGGCETGGSQAQCSTFTGPGLFSFFGVVGSLDRKTSQIHFSF